jgi:hypothetical protein
MLSQHGLSMVVHGANEFADAQGTVTHSVESEPKLLCLWLS